MNERCDAMESNPSSCTNLISGSRVKTMTFLPQKTDNRRNQI